MSNEQRDVVAEQERRRLYAVELVETAMTWEGLPTREALATAAGLDSGTVGDFLNGRRWPRSDTRTKIEAALQMPGGILERIRRFGREAGSDYEGEISARIERGIARGVEMTRGGEAIDGGSVIPGHQSPEHVARGGDEEISSLTEPEVLAAIEAASRRIAALTTRLGELHGSARSMDGAE